MRTSATGSKAPARANGYTLLELLVVMLIIGLVAGLATSLMPSQNNRRQLVVDARKTAGLVAAARNQARVTGRMVRLETRDDGETLILDSGEQELHLQSNITAELRPLIRYDAAPKNLLFFPDGSSSGGEVQLRTGQTSIRIVVDWLTGRPHVR